MDEVSEKHFANALRHLEARIRRELDIVCPVQAVRAEADDYAPPSDAPDREEILQQAVAEAAAAAPAEPKPKKPRPAPKPEHTGYQRRARKRCARTI